MRLPLPRLPVQAAALLVGAICTNALMLQSGRHPAPLFAPAPEPAGQAARQAPAMQQPPARPPAPEADPLVEELQRSLRVLGYYDGAVDGILGPRTRAGLTSYQRAHALEPTGIPSKALLEHASTTGRPPAPLPPAIPPSGSAARS